MPVKSKLEIIKSDESSLEARASIVRHLRADNRRRMPRLHDARSVGFYLKDGAGDVVGGLHAEMHFDWVYLDLLFVPASHQGSGLGRELVSRLTDYARDCNAIGVWLETFGFQARGFYEKCGFEVFGTLEGRDAASCQYLMRMFLTRQPA